MTDEPDEASPALLIERPAPPDGLPGAYSCEHGVSNVPCICHYAVAMSTGQPAPRTMPDDWHATIGGGDVGGLGDALSVD